MKRVDEAFDLVDDQIETDIRDMILTERLSVQPDKMLRQRVWII